MPDQCDLPPPNDADAQPWRNAESFGELCELAAQFLEGQVGYFPGWISSQLYEETLPLRDLLAAINRGGLMTYMSQPGKALSEDPVNGQRAYLSGFMESWKAQQLIAQIQMTSLYIAVYAHHLPVVSRFAEDIWAWPRILVTVAEVESDCFYIGDDRYDFLVGFERCLPICGRTMWEVGQASFVVIVDHEWGRNELFQQVNSALAHIHPLEASDHVASVEQAEPA